MDCFSSIIVICVENKGFPQGAFRSTRARIWELLQTPAGMRRIASEFPHRICRPVGNIYEARATTGGIFSRRTDRLPSRFYQNALFPNDVCCALRLSLDGGKIRLTTNLGGEYICADPDRNAFLMIYKTADKEIAQTHSEGQMVFHPVRKEDLLLSGKAIAFFNDQRLQAGCTREYVKALNNSGRTQQFDSFKFKPG